MKSKNPPSPLAKKPWLAPNHPRRLEWLPGMDNLEKRPRQISSNSSLHSCHLLHQPDQKTPYILHPAKELAWKNCYVWMCPTLAEFKLDPVKLDWLWLWTFFSSCITYTFISDRFLVALPLKSRLVLHETSRLFLKWFRFRFELISMCSSLKWPWWHNIPPWMIDNCDNCTDKVFNNVMTLLVTVDKVTVAKDL